MLFNISIVSIVGAVASMGIETKNTPIKLMNEPNTTFTLRIVVPFRSIVKPESLPIQDEPGGDIDF
jgi:hypothetical protein